MSAPLTAPTELRSRIDPRRVARFLTLLILAISITSVFAHVLRFDVLDGRQRAFLMVLDSNSEHSFSTWYQGITLLIASLLLTAAARVPRQTNEPKRRWWWVLSGMFALLSFDELCELHENVGYAVEKAVHPHGYFHFGWVIPAIVFVFAFVGIYLRFLFQLPLRTRLRFVVAGAIYVSGAVGMEMVSAKYAEAHGEENIVYNLLSDVEESGEMIGVGIFIFALVSHLEEKRARLSVDFSDPTLHHCNFCSISPQDCIRKVA